MIIITDKSLQTISIPKGRLVQVGRSGPTSGYSKQEIDAMLSEKQDTLISGETIKTINGESILGSGNIQIDLSGYYTKEEIDQKNYMNEEQVDAKFAVELDDLYANQIKTNITTDIFDFDNVETGLDQITQAIEYQGEQIFKKADRNELNEYAKKSEIPDISNLATKDEVSTVESKIPTIPTNVSSFNNDAGYLTELSLSGYATESWVNQQSFAKETDIPTDYAKPSDITDAINSQEFKTINGESIKGSGNITIQGGGGIPTHILHINGYGDDYSVSDQEVLSLNAFLIENGLEGSIVYIQRNDSSYIEEADVMRFIQNGDTSSITLSGYWNWMSFSVTNGVVTYKHIEPTEHNAVNIQAKDYAESDIAYLAEGTVISTYLNGTYGIYQKINGSLVKMATESYVSSQTGGFETRISSVESSVSSLRAEIGDIESALAAIIG